MGLMDGGHLAKGYGAGNRIERWISAFCFGFDIGVRGIAATKAGVFTVDVSNEISAYESTMRRHRK